MHVRIHDGYEIATRIAKACVHRAFLPKITGKGQVFYARVRFRKAFDDLQGSILGRKNTQSDRTEEYIQEICNRILEKVAEDMEEGIETDRKRDKAGEIPYSTFKGKITKK